MTWVKLFKDIGLNQSMKKTLDFTSKIEQVKWFRAKEQIKDCVSINDVAYNKFQNVLNIPIGPDELIKSYDMAQSFTYAEMGNVESATISNRHYYFFVSDVILIDDSTVHFILTLDPIQTYMCEYELDECMVNVAHVDRWEKDRYNDIHPSRITPVTSKINCYMNWTNITSITQPILDNPQYPLKPSNAEYIKPENIRIVMMCYTKREQDKVVVNTCYSIAGIKEDKDGNRFTNFNVNGIFWRDLISYETHRMPSLDAVISGQLPTIFNIPAEDVLFVSILPFCNMGVYSEDYEVVPSPDRIGYGFKYGKGFFGHYGANRILGKENSTNVSMFVINDKFIEDQEILLLENRSTFGAYPPRNNSKILPAFEPKLHMQPYVKKCISDGLGRIVMEFPDNIVKPDENIDVRGRILTGNSSISILIYNKDIISDSVNGASAIVEPIYIDVINNHWLDYYLTERTQDRNMIANNNLNAAIDNLMFMSYGGALVGSRSASGVNDPSSKNATGNSSIEGFQKFRGMGGMASAVGMASGASLITSMVDTHFAWENQKEVEDKIKNKPNGLMYVGGGQQLANEFGTKLNLVLMECDKVNMDRAFERFTHYGYELNQFMKLNTRSRKLYNFVMTNGAIIKGSIPNKIKEQIATIFDNGITIFHADYSPNTEYTDEENIERSLM